jgi:hypothetical protein
MSASLAVTASLEFLLVGVGLTLVAVVALYVGRRQAHRPAGRPRRLAASPVADDAPLEDVAWGDGADASPRPSRTPPPDDPQVAAPVRARYGPDTFALVAEHVDHTQRLAFAEARVERVLDTLPMGHWYVQRFTLVAGHRIPFLILGECGVFALWVVAYRPQWSDPEFVSDIAANVKRRLPAYPGPVNVGLCGVLKPDIKPRFWYRSGDGGGAWILGVDWLIPWMEHFGHQHGLSVKDIDRFRALATPDWSRPVAPVPPGIPIIDAGVPNTE